MTVYFLDSSALVKRYVTETGTAWVRAITTRNSDNTIIIAQIAPIETISALMRRKRDGSISVRTAKAARLFVDRHAIREYEMVYFPDPVVQRAKDLLDTYPLRAIDAIQLASALEANARLLKAGLSPLIFVCSDNRLLAAATSEGLIVHNPI